MDWHTAQIRFICIQSHRPTPQNEVQVLAQVSHQSIEPMPYWRLEPLMSESLLGFNDVSETQIIHINNRRMVRAQGIKQRFDIFWMISNFNHNMKQRQMNTSCERLPMFNICAPALDARCPLYPVRLKRTRACRLQDPVLQECLGS